MAYRGPRDFPDFESRQRQALSRLAEEVARVAHKAEASLRWSIPKTRIRGEAMAAFETALMVDTEDGGLVTIFLPIVTSKEGGRSCGVIRLFAAGTLQVAPTGGAKLYGQTTPTTLPASEGFYVFLWDGARWNEWRS